MPENQLPLAISPMLEMVLPALPKDRLIHLTGGAVRDALMGLPNHDLDFVLQKDAIKVARQVADHLKAAFYPLDEDRDSGRVIVFLPDRERLILDFAVYRGSNLENDLRLRDFTVDAIAIEAHPPHNVFDPLNGARDVLTRQIRACSPESFLNDPIRILRGVRLATGLDFRIRHDTKELMIQSVGLLPQVSMERLRDELFKIFEGRNVSVSIRTLDMLGALSYVLPELENTKGTQQSPPHISEVWDHSLAVENNLQMVFDVLSLTPNQDRSASLHMGLVSVLLGRYREQIYEHMENNLNPNRSARSLLNFAALYHDVGKPDTYKVDEKGRIRFFEHEEVGAEKIKQRARALQLSNAEIQRLSLIIRHHLRPILLAQNNRFPTRRAIYRFFRDTGPAGVDICLLSLADVLGTYGYTLPQAAWTHQLEVVRSLLEAWWERPEESVAPAPLLTGHDLIESIGLEPGPLIGKILERIREAQATGEIQTQEEALDLARQLVDRKKDG